MHRIPLPFDENILPQTKGVYLVGGSVRDLLTDTHLADYDIAVCKNPEDFARRLSGRIHGRLVLLGKPDKSLFRVVGADTVFDVTAVKGGSIEADLFERDFTVNAMALALDSKTLIDPFQGRADLVKKRLRIVSENVFKKDPVRLVRAFRICCLHGFHMDAGTASRIRMESHRITQSPPERISAELFRILSTLNASETLLKMADLGLLFHILPELKETVGCTQNRHHAFDVFQHTLNALAHLEQLQEDPQKAFPRTGHPIKTHMDRRSFSCLKWAMLLHDIGKPATKSTGRQGSIHFFGHEKIGAAMAAAICRRLRLSNRHTDETVFLVRNHIKPLFLYLSCKKARSQNKAKARFFLRCGRRTPALLLHVIADIRGKGNPQSLENEAFLAFVGHLLEDYFENFQKIQRLPPLINGFDLMRELNLAPSARFKTVLDRVREAQISGEIQDKAAALALAREVSGRANAPGKSVK